MVPLWISFIIITGLNGLLLSKRSLIDSSLASSTTKWSSILDWQLRAYHIFTNFSMALLREELFSEIEVLAKKK